MDWTMVGNAEDAVHRVQTVYYLTRFRYGLAARKGGAMLAAEWSHDSFCAQTMAELRAELSCPSGNLAMVKTTDAEARLYLTELLQAFDQTVAGH